MCPYCRTNAPLVYRGVRAYCAACGAKRSVLSASSLTYAGQPAQVGGAVVQAFGWLALMFGVSFSALVALVVWAFATGMAAFVTFAVMSLMALGFFLLVRKGGKKLSETGDDTRAQRREQALFALAANNGGVLQAMQAAAALDLPVNEADKFMTQLAKTRDDVDVEIGDEGEVFYTFGRGVVIGPAGSVRAAWGARPGPRVRIEDLRNEVRSAAVPRPPEHDIRLKNAIDVEFEAIEEENNARARNRAGR